MYQISDQQIDYILSDIGARGVEMESLQQNLLDHVCCIIENNLEANGDFESFYQTTIKTFYKDALWEIEEETLLLLIYKNYYAMKKIMIMSGIVAATTFITGSIFKIMHWPGASFFIFIGMVTSSLIFLPLYFIFKKKETTETKNKLILAVGTINGILFCASSLFKMMHWPYSHLLWLLTIGMMVFVFIPLFFFNGIKREETKTNTIATTIILIIVAGFFFALTSLKSSKQVYISDSYNYLQSEELINRMQLIKNDSTNQTPELVNLSKEINDNCNEIKRMIIMDGIGVNLIPKDFESKGLILEESGMGGSFNPGEHGITLITKLKDQINSYNKLQTKNDQRIDNTIEKMLAMRLWQQSNYNVLSAITQIQLFVLINEKHK
jgi:uncharacterized membrane protein